MDDLQGKCDEFKIVFEDAISGLETALGLLEAIQAEKRRLYGRPSYQGFNAALNVGQFGPSPWAGVRKADGRLIRLLQGWQGNTTPRPETYRPPDIFGKPPEPEKPELAEKPKPGLTERVLGRFFSRPG